jgi:hypothetical protein
MWMADDYFKRSNWNRKDEYYTPPILVEAILPHIVGNPKETTVWCPFDTDKSAFVEILRERNFKVIHSHIWEGKDFFQYEPEEEYDYIISNPPFTRKLDVFKRLFDLGKPFAMVMGLPILNYQEVGDFFTKHQQQGHHIQLLIVDKKVSFDGNTASFNNSFFCWDMLQRDIVFHHLAHNNSGDDHIGSRMKVDSEERGIEPLPVRWLFD